MSRISDEFEQWYQNALYLLNAAPDLRRGVEFMSAAFAKPLRSHENLQKEVEMHNADRLAQAMRKDVPVEPQWTVAQLESWSRARIAEPASVTDPTEFAMALGIMALIHERNDLRAMGHEHAEMIQNSGDVLRVGETCGRAIERLRRVAEAMK